MNSLFYYLVLVLFLLLVSPPSKVNFQETAYLSNPSRAFLPRGYSRYTALGLNFSKERVNFLG